MKKILKNAGYKIKALLILITVVSIFLCFGCDSSDQNSPNGSNGTGTGDIIPPSEVTDFTATAGDGMVTLNWNDPTDSDFARVEITYSPGGTSPVNVSKGFKTKTFSSLTNATLYTFTIKTIDDTGNKSAGNTASATPQTVDITPPHEVSDLTATSGDGMVTLNWNDPTDSDFVKVQITFSPGGTSPVEVSKGVKTKLFPSLTNGTTYTFTVKTIDGTGNKSVGSTASATPQTVDITPPHEVSDLTATAGNGMVTLNWNDPTDSDFAKVEITFSPGGASPVNVSKGVKTKTFSSLMNGTSYTFTIKTIDGTGNKSAGLTVTSAPTQVITLELSYIYGSSSMSNIYVIWIEDASSNFIQNLSICNKLVKGGLTNTALPFWKLNRYPKSDMTEVDAVTAATKAKQNFVVTAQLKDINVRKFTIYFETDFSFDANDWFGDQPAILYKADIDLDNLPANSEYELIFCGWTPNEGTENVIPSTPKGTLQDETRYITNFKNGTGFGDPDPARSATMVVDKLMLKIK
ncbi:MAG: DUF4959 domain-containing protein [Spirochaetes bacterium]|nr:DUF4959 domain-containing protein [Spirochaetota bacterium]